MTQQQQKQYLSGGHQEIILMLPSLKQMADQDEFTDGRIPLDERDEDIKDFMEQFEEEMDSHITDMFWEKYSEFLADRVEWNKEKAELKKSGKKHCSQCLSTGYCYCDTPEKREEQRKADIQAMKDILAKDERKKEHDIAMLKATGFM